jgi:hypothetical protein
MFSTVAFYLTTELVLTNRRFYAVRPSTIFGMIPVGTKRSSYPVENIAGVNAATRFHVAGVIIGLLGLTLGSYVLTLRRLEVLGILVVLLSLNAILNAPRQGIEVLNSGGGAINFPVSVFERRRTLEFADSVSEAIARPARSQGSPPPQSAAIQPSDPAAALRELERLRVDRLITDDEYGQKRAEILRRL